MKKITLISCLILLIFASTNGKFDGQSPSWKPNEVMDKYVIASNGDLKISQGEETILLEINALPDAHIIEDERQRLLILSDPTDQYKHGILGDELEATSVTLVDLWNQPRVVSKFSVPKDWVIESIQPIWRDWDGDGQKEIVLTLSNDSSGAKLVLYDESGEALAESEAIGRGYRWRHTLDIASFGTRGQRFLVDVQTPHIGGIVNFYSWDKGNELLKIEGNLSGYSTHDIGSRAMNMYALIVDEEREQTLLIIPIQSKTALAALRYESGAIHEEWRISLGGRLEGNLELVDEDGKTAIRTFVDNNQEVLLSLPE